MYIFSLQYYIYRTFHFILDKYGFNKSAYDKLDVMEKNNLRQNLGPIIISS